MSTDAAKPTPFNPTWIAVAILAVGQLVGIGMDVQRGNATNEEVADLKQWRVATEKRLAESDRTSAVTNKSIEKDLQSLNLNVDALRRSLEVRGVPIVAPVTFPNRQ